uniref:Gelsolin-like domain-containing protein n=1 Tax=Schistosoma mansoni TaxID=6183 RepID=A0A3Q0KKZ1_SCHMA
MTNKVSELLPFDSRQIICELKEYNIQLKLLFLRLNSCLFIWLGNEESKLSGLSVCLPSQISTSNQHSTTIYSVTGASRNPFSEYEENLSCKISKRFHCPIFVSISLPYEFAPLWNNINVITQSTLGQKVEHCIFENLSTIILS